MIYKLWQQKLIYKIKALKTKDFFIFFFQNPLKLYIVLKGENLHRKLYAQRRL